MHRQGRVISWVVALLALTLLASGCGRGDEGGGGGGGGGGGSDPGITDKEIKLGGSYPFSGPASAYRAIADGAKAQFEYVNSQGGVDGRKISFRTLDDAYELPQAVVATGASNWGSDVASHPYTTGWQPNYVTEAKIYADYLKKNKKDAKVA